MGVYGGHGGHGQFFPSQIPLICNLLGVSCVFSVHWMHNLHDIGQPASDPTLPSSSDELVKLQSSRCSRCINRFEATLHFAHAFLTADMHNKIEYDWIVSLNFISVFPQYLGTMQILKHSSACSCIFSACLDTRGSLGWLWGVLETGATWENCGTKKKPIVKMKKLGLGKKCESCPKHWGAEGQNWVSLGKKGERFGKHVGVLLLRSCVANPQEAT
jgi:hypothetical protein